MAATPRGRLDTNQSGIQKGDPVVGSNNSGHTHTNEDTHLTLNKDATLRDDPGRNSARAGAGEAEQREKNGAELCVVRGKDSNCGLVVCGDKLRPSSSIPIPPSRSCQIPFKKKYLKFNGVLLLSDMKITKKIIKTL
jgi:hypothetical protein